MTGSVTTSRARITGGFNGFVARLLPGFTACAVALALTGPAAAIERNMTAAAPSGALGEATSELPTRLTNADAALYRTIFSLQERADWATADQEIKKLKDRVLLGHVLAQRYLHPQYRSAYPELSAWLSQYADHPDAPTIYKMAGRKAPRGASPAHPTGETVGGLWMLDDLGPPPDRAPPAGRKLTGPA